MLSYRLGSYWGTSFVGDLHDPIPLFIAAAPWRDMAAAYDDIDVVIKLECLVCELLEVLGGRSAGRPSRNRSFCPGQVSQRCESLMNVTDQMLR
jgi:hypothetical protein